ncbi:hypothetical protein H6F90_10695 [Trichocoleus sp. FACHB-591]|uniref:hypothetical protein n=1 Tax=Trichocoleus sp. FACHB-591 TaxID=2692872 RepID=UPI00168418DD|nr:hypothetical protein [Trichocoleus sp. FACHB-591]MBD2095622.1 hypothetical protein [Trichocoleus sp. FACHB-591]
MNTRESKNPLIRDGIAQQQRQMAALSPDFVQVDETDLADFLVFAYELSQRVIYYDEQDQMYGSWRAFFERSTPVRLALINKTRPEIVQNQYNQALKGFLAQWAIAPTAALLAAEPRLDSVEKILDIYAEILCTLHSWNEGLTDGTSLKAVLHTNVSTNLLQPARRIAQIEKGLFIQHPSSQKNTLDRYKNYYTKFAQSFDIEVLSQAPSYHPPQSDDLPSFQDLRQLVTNREQAQAELNSIFQPLYQTYSRVIQLASDALPQSLTVDQSLSPHLALYVAFWHVLKPARMDLNRMTQRHLDFFYREVLRLSERPAQPDKTHVILELAKFQPTYKLDSQTRFTAGTDATGVDLFYTLNDEIVVSTAQVVELKGLFRHSQPQQGASKDSSKDSSDQEILGLHASPVANSFDGKGGKFPSDQTIQAWFPFGNENRPAVEVGLAIASNILLLQEGDRTITFIITLNFPSKPDQSAIREQLIKELRVEFSGTTGWIDGAIAPGSVKLDAKSDTAYTLTIQVHLPVGTAPVVPYHPDLPGGKLATNRPAARLILHHHDDADDQHTQPPESSILEPALSAYHYLCQATLGKIDITVSVDGVRTLLLQNDFTTLDATKPFLPFGIQPKVGTSFYIGSQEVFQKCLTQLKLAFDLETDPPYERDTINWSKIYAAYGVTYEVTDGIAGNSIDTGNSIKSFNPGCLTIHALRERQWHPTTSAEYNLFTQNQPGTSSPKYSIDLKEPNLSALQLDRPVKDPLEGAELEPWSYQSQYGFLRFQLTGDDFLHTDYPTVLARQVLATATQETLSGDKRRSVIGAYYEKETTKEIFKAETYNQAGVNDAPILPGEPYTPVIKSLQIDYTATATHEDCQLFHLYPFDGFASLTLQPSSAESIRFLPQFDHEGELLIGLQNLEPSTSLSLLFEVVEETANTDLERAVVTWHYLIDNTWKKFDAYLILKDTSNGLIRSGIVKLAIAADISNASTTILNPALHWIKASVESRSQAICQMLSIQAQAAEITFVDEGNDPNHLSKPLPAESLTKLANPQPEINQVRQPFPSFGGKVKEQPAQFYTRVSEHLHHKGRAVTIFDYERLVLDRFPEIYKVRCINHGQMTTPEDYREIAPGHITLAVIPTLSQRRSINDLKPKVNINLLAEIKQYLKALSSPWANIHVINPHYEEISVAFKVQFKAPFQSDFSFYQRQLESDIIGFLSPWTLDGGTEVHFGGEIYLSSILNFVEERPYVSYVVDFQLYQRQQDQKKSALKATDQKKSVLKATVSTPQSILVSVPPFAREPFRHVIEDIPESTSKPNTNEKENKLGYSPRIKLQG